MALILIADDNSQNLYLLESILKGYGHGVTCAGNGAKALELARQSPPDLIITDIFMPIMDGFVLCREWKADERLKDVPFIFYTATYTDPKDEQFALNLGAERFLIKPMEAEAIAKVVGQVLRDVAERVAQTAPADDTETLRQYSEVLLRKLEKKVVQLENEIVERKRAEQILLESEEKFRQLAENIHEVFWIWERERLSYVSPACEQIFGLNKEDLLNAPDSFFDIVHDEDKERVQRMHSGKDGKEVKKTEYRIIRPDGSIRWIYSRSFPLMQNGEIVRTVGIAEDITGRKRMDEQLQSRLGEIERLKKQLERENIFLREEVKLLTPHAEIVATSPAMQQVMLQVDQVARTDSTVLITGETGTGKDVVARTIHLLSSRQGLPLITTNCASLPPTLIESELFGREKGAFTGAMSRVAGRFEIANGSTLFLDEIGDLPLEVQAKLLRVLEEGHLERLGSTKSLKVNVRIIAATNRDLFSMVQTGKFRNDLYYRLNVFPIVIPPLRERKEDIQPLIWEFVHQFEKRMGRQIESIPKRSMDTLLNYPWPGNARELRNVIEHAMIVSRGTALDVRLPIFAPLSDLAEKADNLQETERRHVLRVLEERCWRVSGRGGAAEILGLKPTTLEARMKKLGIQRPR